MTYPSELKPRSRGGKVIYDLSPTVRHLTLYEGRDVESGVVATFMVEMGPLRIPHRLYYGETGYTSTAVGGVFIADFSLQDAIRKQALDLYEDLWSAETGASLADVDYDTAKEDALNAQREEEDRQTRWETFLREVGIYEGRNFPS